MQSNRLRSSWVRAAATSSNVVRKVLALFALCWLFSSVSHAQCLEPPDVTVYWVSPANNATLPTAPENVQFTVYAGGHPSVSLMQFWNGSTFLGDGTAIGNNQYQFTWSNVGAGTYTITAKAKANKSGCLAASDQADITFKVPAPNAAPTISITSPASGNVLSGPTANVSIAVNAADSDGTVTRVDYYADGISIGADTAAPFSFTWSGAAADTYSLTAVATDNGGAKKTSSAVSVRINALPTVSLTSSATTDEAPGAFTLTASASDSDGTISKVEFISNGSVIATDTTAPYSYAWSGLAVGTYSVTARATDNNNQQKTSAARTLTVTVANAAPIVSISSPASGAVLLGPTANIVIAAAASDSDGSVQRVDFYVDGGTSPIATDTVAPYSFAWSSVASGTHTIVARAVDNLNKTNDATVTVRVNALPTATVAATPTTTVIPATVTLTSTATDSDGTVSKVEFLSNGSILATDTSSPYSFTWSNVAPGSYSITARSTDNNGQTKTSAAVVVTVQEVAAIAVPNAAAYTGGSLSGAVAVDQNGAATYDIPIAVPPGTAGMAPALSLNYSSLSGTGLMGVGWSVTGLSQITRCAPTVAQDGARRAVELKATDRYCLDGQRLILLSGTYGATAEYRTEIESFSRIKSFGSDTAKGPDRWEVQTKAGLLLHYGNTADSAVEAQGTSPAVILKWSLAKAQDRKGNYWAATYDESTAEGEHYPDQISYTGNAALTPYAAVRFVYEATRPDTEVSYVAGAKVSTLRRLSAVQTFYNIAADGSGGTLTRDFRISYVVSSQNGRSLVGGIKDCSGAGTCIPMTGFQWQQMYAADRHFNAPGSGVWGGPVAVFDSLNGYPLKRNVYNSVALGDLNGDGKTDLLKSLETGSWQACLSTGTGFDCQTWAGPALKLRDAVFGDFNGDGRLDLMHAGASGGALQACLSTGTSFNCVSWAGLTAPISLAKIGYRVADFNGDGRDDFASASYCYSTGSAFNCSAFTLPVYNISDVDPICPEEQIRRRSVPGDYNGDGRTDYLTIQTWSSACPPSFATHSYSWSLNSATDDAGGRGFARLSPAPGLPTVDINTGEVYGATASNIGATNADDYPDIVLQGLTGSQLKVCRATGKGFVCSTPTTNASTYDYVAHNIADFDGDGRSDAYHGVDNATGRVCQLGSAAALSCLAWQLPNNPSQYGVFGAYGDFNGDGKTDTAYYNESTQKWSIWLAGGIRPDLLSQVTNGLGHVTQISYKPLSDESVHTADSSVPYPQRSVQDSTHVVAQVRVSNAIGGWLVTDYRYGGLRSDLEGRGLLGFRWMESSDQVSHITTRTEFRQDFPFIGMVAKKTETHDSGVVLHYSVNTLAIKTGCTGPGEIPYISDTGTVRRDLNGASLPGLTVTTQIDCFANPVAISSSVSYGADTYSTSITNTFDNVTTSWRIGELRCSRVTKGAPGVPSENRTVGTDYDSFGLVLRETVEPRQGTLACATTDVGEGYEVKHEYGRDVYGNIATKTLKWTEAGLAKSRRVEDVVYESRGRFPQTIKNALDHTETRVYSDTVGQPTSVTDQNGLVTAWQYDTWGRKIKETRPDATYTDYSYKQCGTSCNGGQLAVISTPSNGVPRVTYIDVLQRDVRYQTWGFNGTEIVTDLEYDSLGRLSRTARKRFASQAAVWTTYDRDDLGRTWRITDPDGTSTVDFNGIETTFTDALSHTRKEVRNGLDKLSQVVDHNGMSVSYRYQPWGNVDRIIDAKANTVAISYDRLGRKTALRDPDLGWVTYRFNAIGELQEQINPVQRSLGQLTSFQYDSLGRLVTRIDSDATATWVYDSCTKGSGKLCEAHGANNYVRKLTYDAKGRMSSEQVNLDQTYITTHGYDSEGRLATTSHIRAPLNGTTGPGQTFSYVYNSIGYLKQIQSGGGATLWTVEDRDALNRVKREALGNGLDTWRSFSAATGRLAYIYTGPNNTPTVQTDVHWYNAVGDIYKRSFLDQTGSPIVETFTYDNLRRLTGSTIGSDVKTYAYDEIGNLASKTGVGSYTYPASGAASIRPHALSAVTGAVNGIVNPTFVYDANGNLLSGAGRVWTWTSANMPKDISQGALKSSFLYGPDRQRVKQTITNAGTEIATKYYAGAIEKEVSGGATIVRTYLPMGVGVIVEDGAATKVRYFHRDHLGSIVGISDETGSVLERYRYDAWGKRRNSNGTDVAGALTSNIDDTGYTDHEMLDAIGLIHMNGRIYDPAVARMTRADPYASDADDLQGLNRYAYVLNNPINYTDPTGFDSDTTKDLTVTDRKTVTATLDRVVVTGKSPTYVSPSIYSPATRVVPVPRVPSEGRRTMASVGLVATVPMRSLLAVAGTAAVGTGLALSPVVITGTAIVGAWLIFEYHDLIFNSNGDQGPDPKSAAASPGTSSAAGSPPPDDDDDPNNVNLTREEKKAIKSYEKRIAEHEKKISSFKENPTTRPGMEGQPEEVIKRQQAARIQHLETEIRTFRANIDKILNGR